MRCGPGRRSQGQNPGSWSARTTGTLRKQMFPEPGPKGGFVNLEGFRKMKMTARHLAGGATGMKYMGPPRTWDGGKLKFLEGGRRHRRDFSPIPDMGGIHSPDPKVSAQIRNLLHLKAPKPERPASKRIPIKVRGQRSKVRASAVHGGAKVTGELGKRVVHVRFVLGGNGLLPGWFSATAGRGVKRSPCPGASAGPTDAVQRARARPSAPRRFPSSGQGPFTSGPTATATLESAVP